MQKSVAPWITVLSWHTVFTIGVIYKFTSVRYSAKQGTTHVHITSGTFIHCALSLAMRRTQMATELGDFTGHYLFLWLSSRKTFFYSKSDVRNQNFTDGFLLEFDFFPSHSNRHLQQSALFTLLCMTRHSCSNPMPLRYECLLQREQNGSKATMCYWRVPKMFLVDGQLCVACYYPTSRAYYPSSTKGTSVGPPVAVKIDFWALVLSELYGYSTPLTTFLVNN